MKGQVSMEFMIISFVVLSILLLVFATASRTQFFSQETQLQRKVKDICENVADKINKAIYYGGGFSQGIFIPDKVYGNNYTIKVENNRTLVCSTEKFSIVKIFVENKIENETSVPPFFIEKGSVVITNKGGMVKIQ
jgi:hypothetical protein